MELFVKSQIKLGCRVLLSQIRCQLFFLFLSVSVIHPKAVRRLSRRRNPWPWPTMATWICNCYTSQGRAPPRTLLTAFRLEASTSITYFWLLAALSRGGDICCTGKKAADRTNLICCWRAMWPRTLAPTNRTPGGKRRTLGKGDKTSQDIHNEWTSSFFFLTPCNVNIKWLQPTSHQAHYWVDPQMLIFRVFVLARIKGTTWWVVSSMCQEGDKTSRVSSHDIQRR